MQSLLGNHTAEKCLQSSQYIGTETHLQPSLGSPGKAQPVGQDRGRDSGPVVAAPTHEHYTQTGHTPLRAEGHLRGAGDHLRPTQRA